MSELYERCPRCLGRADALGRPEPAGCVACRHTGYVPVGVSRGELEAVRAALAVARAEVKAAIADVAAGKTAVRALRAIVAGPARVGDRAPADVARAALGRILESRGDSVPKGGG